MASLFIVGLVLALVVAALHSALWGQPDHSIADAAQDRDMHSQNTTFTIRFDEKQYSPGLRIKPDGDPQKVIDSFGLLTPRPTIFISGGASNMRPEDIERTREIIDQGIAAFAAAHNITVIDGGTEAGVMQMIGQARAQQGYKFPLIGVAPVERVAYPGWQGRKAEAALQAGHSHFVLIESDEWGDESQMIVNLTRAIANRDRPMLGILINGGKIAEKDVFLATATGANRIPILIVDGSGRTANKISTAYKTQRTDNFIIQMIIKGGDIRLSALTDGVPAIRQHLQKHFLDDA